MMTVMMMMIFWRHSSNFTFIEASPTVFRVATYYHELG